MRDGSHAERSREQYSHFHFVESTFRKGVDAQLMPHGCIAEWGVNEQSLRKWKIIHCLRASIIQRRDKYSKEFLFLQSTGGDGWRRWGEGVWKGMETGDNWLWLCKGKKGTLGQVKARNLAAGCNLEAREWRWHVMWAGAITEGKWLEKRSKKEGDDRSVRDESKSGVFCQSPFFTYLFFASSVWTRNIHFMQ